MDKDNVVSGESGARKGHSTNPTQLGFFLEESIRDLQGADEILQLLNSKLTQAQKGLTRPMGEEYLEDARTLYRGFHDQVGRYQELFEALRRDSLPSLVQTIQAFRDLLVVEEFSLNGLRDELKEPDKP